MLPKEIRERAEYLSEHFDCIECRKELYDLIHKFLNQ